METPLQHQCLAEESPIEGDVSLKTTRKRRRKRKRKRGRKRKTVPKGD